MLPYVPPCSIDGCGRKTHGRSPYCAYHHYRDYSHGHPRQDPVYPILKEPIARLTKWGKTPEGRRAIDAAVAQYIKLAELKLAEWRDDYDEMVRTGIKHSSPHHEATEIIAQTYQSKDPRKTVMQLLALGILLEEDPQVFKSDRAFLFETTHVFMRGSAAKQQFRWRPQQGRRMPTTRYIRKKTRQKLGEWLTREIVWLGVLLHREWTKKGAAEKKAKADLIAAFKGEASAST